MAKLDDLSIRGHQQGPHSLCAGVYPERAGARAEVAGLLPILFGEEEAREADKARLALGPSARKERGRRCLLPIGVILRILDWTAMRGSYGGCIV